MTLALEKTNNNKEIVSREFLASTHKEIERSAKINTSDFDSPSD